MRKRKTSRILGMFALALAFCLAWIVATESRGGAAAGTADYIDGVVTSSKGPEAGVWVIAETTDLPTKYAKIVVTDDQGRYALPELPTANYEVFVRGYGLVDSARVPAKPGQHLDLKAVVAPDGRAAAQIYPANYWLSLVKIPSGKLAPDEVAGRVKLCMNCHQLGDKATREIPAATKDFGPFNNSTEAWDRRTKSGPVGANMTASYLSMGEQRSLFADWTDRIAAGEYPKEAPPRPSGVERNLVLTLWDWGTQTNYMHDEAASDLRNPMVNPNGPVFGVMTSGNSLVWLDPIKNTASEIKIPSQAVPLGSMEMPSPYWGDENIWLAAAQPRSAAVDQVGRVWFASRNARRRHRFGRRQTAGFLQGRIEQQVCPVLPHAARHQASCGLRSGEEGVFRDRHVLHDGPQRVRRRRQLVLRPERFCWMGQYRGVGQNPQ